MAPRPQICNPTRLRDTVTDRPAVVHDQCFAIKGNRGTKYSTSTTRSEHRSECIISTDKRIERREKLATNNPAVFFCSAFFFYAMARVRG